MDPLESEFNNGASVNEGLKIVSNPEDGSSMFLRNVGIHMALQPRRSTSTSSPP
jgi:hypothetical protein